MTAPDAKPTPDLKQAWTDSSEIANLREENRRLRRDSDQHREFIDRVFSAQDVGGFCYAMENLRAALNAPRTER